MSERSFVHWFRHAGPYINAHRDKTFVIAFGGEALINDAEFSALVHDFALLHSLGARLVLVPGARPQIDAQLHDSARRMRYVNGLRITDFEDLKGVEQAVGNVRIRVEAKLSMGLANSPMQGARIHVASGNFVTARPLGVRDGVDYCFTGEVRRIDARAIHTCLDHKAIVLLGTLGYSPTGEVFNLSAGEIAVATAIALQADKLLLLGEGADVVNDRGELIRQLTLADVSSEPAIAKLPSDVRRQLDHALRACRGGVRRAHLLDRRVDGALLRELYTRDGVGTMVAADLYERLRQATIEDIGGILELIAPLEIDGTLVRRSRELLEMEIDRFTILERDGTTIGCAALYAFHEERLGELACLAVHTDYRRSSRADALLQHIEACSRQLGLEKLFVLTTRAAHWFQERGFVAAEITDLPVSRQLLYNLQRRSKVFIKPLI